MKRVLFILGCIISLSILAQVEYPWPPEWPPEPNEPISEWPLPEDPEDPDDGIGEEDERIEVCVLCEGEMNLSEDIEPCIVCFEIEEEDLGAEL